MDQNKQLEKATFAGGCFWCMEPAFEAVDGVTEVMPGYAGGKIEQPTYEEVSTGTTGHVEAVQITFNTEKVSYKTLLELFWQQIDPTDQEGQFADRGSQYETAIFYHNEEQRRLAAESKTELEKSGRFKKPIATRIRKFTSFYPAEQYHRDYHKKEALSYQLYKKLSGREKYLDEVWKDRKNSNAYQKPRTAELKKKLSDLQYKVTQENATEPPFANEFWKNDREGIYVDIVSGEPLFSSKDKFNSGCGWPSFTKPLVRDNLVERIDSSLGMIRTEVRSKKADSHLGHRFDDGPEPTGLRYCINSAALRFIPEQDLEKEGYGEYKKLFEN